MSVFTAAGSKLYIGSPNQDRNTVLADYVADSYIEVGEIEDMGEFGDEAEIVPFTSLQDGRTRKFKGSRDAGTMTLVVGDDMLDEGQVALEAAEAESLNYNFYVELNDAVTIGGTNSKHYFIAMVTSKRRNVGNANNIVRRNFALGVNSAIIASDPS